MLLAFLSFFQAEAQEKTFSISGIIQDENGSVLPQATVVLLENQDSVLYSYTSSNSEGEFLLKKVKPGDYIFQITFLGFEKYQKALSLKESLDLGIVELSEEKTILEEVEVSDYRIPIEIKGDTVQYNADAFKTKENAVVEDLLRKLPGVQVERDGSIRAHGEKVARVLVDGKEFFGDDPKMATKSLPANVIENVQVFDKASEIAEFTGVDDGNSKKTINLSLKEDKKQGYFGSVLGGYGTDDRYLGKANYNRFSEDLQLSAIGNANNINQETFSLEDQINFAGGIQELLSGGGGFFYQLSPGNQSGQNVGVRTAQSAGVNFNFEPKETVEINTNYRINHVENNPNISLLRQNFLNGEIFETRENTQRKTSFSSHLLNFKVYSDLNESTELILKTNLKANKGEQFENSFSETFDAQSNLSNSSERQNENTEHIINLNTEVSVRHRFKRPGRFMVATFDFDYLPSNRDNQIRSSNGFFSEEETTLEINQLQDQSDSPINYNANLNYTEPLGKGKYLEFLLGRTSQFNSFNKAFFDFQDSEFLLNDELSRIFERNYDVSEGGVRFKWNRKKTNISLGAIVENATLKGEIENENVTINQTFLNVLPSVSYNWDIRTGQRLQASYSTRVQEPSIQQLQPVIDNSNPIQTYVGNPDLNPEYTHELSLNYNLFDQFNFLTLFSSVRTLYTANRIVNSRIIDDQLQQIIMPVNTDENVRLNVFLNLSSPVRPLKVKFNLAPTVDFEKGIVFLNEQENVTRRFSPSIKFEIENRKKEKIDWLVGTRFNKTTTRYALDSDLDQQFFKTEYYADVIYSFAKHWELGVNFNYERNRGSAFPTTQNISLLNTYLAKSFLKDNRAQFKVEVFDLLNENVGLSRTSNSNFVQERNFNTLNRYLLFSFYFRIGAFGNELDIKTER